MEWLSSHHLTVFITFLTLSPLLQDGSMAILRCPVRSLKNGRVRIRSKGRVAKYVCLRNSQVLGDQYSTCINGKWDSPVPICIKNGCLPIDVPHGQVLETYRGALLTVHCDLGYTLIGSRSIYCNGAAWNDTQPACKEMQVSAQKWCDFESEDLCGWTHDSTHDFDWRRHSFATPSGHIGTGPSFDHTLGPGLNGHYMYLEVSSPRLENDTARLFSPVFNAVTDPGACFIFWYHMFGATTGTVNVYIHKQDTTLLFSKSGDQGNQWLQAVVPLPQVTSSFQIVIEGVRGAGYEGDIAIDDVKLAEGPECSVPTSTSPSDEQETATAEVDSSCAGRCHMTPVLPTMCECTPDCIGNNTCCPDFVLKCSTNVSSATIGTGLTTVKPSTSLPVTSTSNGTSAVLSNTTIATVLSNTTIATVLSNTTIPTVLPNTTIPTVLPNTTIPTVLPNTTIPTVLPNTTIATVLPNTTIPTVLPNTTIPTVLPNTTIPTVLPNTTIPTVLSNTTIPTVLPNTTITSTSALPNNTYTSTPSYHPTLNDSQTEEVTSKISPKSVSESLNTKSSFNDSYTTVARILSTTTPLPNSTTVLPVANSTVAKQSMTSPSKVSVNHATNLTVTTNGTFTTTPSMTVVPTTPSLKTTAHSKITWPTKSSTKPTTTPFQWKPLQFTPNTRPKPTIKLVDPPPPVVYRTPTGIKSFTRSVRNEAVNVSTTFTTPKKEKSKENKERKVQRKSPKKMSNKTEKVPKSKNDVLHPVWFKNPLTTPTLPPLGPIPGTLTNKTSIPTTHPTTQTPTMLYFRRSNSTKPPTEYKSKSKKKPKVVIDTPIHEEYAVATPLPQHVSLIIMSVSSVVLTTALVAACHLWRRKINRRRMEDDELDIQFLASDEILDFTLARPSMEDIQMRETRR